jgi:cytochrome c peroxidase
MNAHGPRGSNVLPRLALLGVLSLASACVDTPSATLFAPHTPTADVATALSLDAQLAALLASNRYTGRIAAMLPTRLGRPVNGELADIGRLLFFDAELGLNNDNSCAGCHSPRNGFGDSQSIAIGIQNNGIVGPGRQGPRNQRRTPVITNIAFYPALMWNSRFHSNAGDPFDNSAGFTFPPPEGASLSYLPHLLDAQAFIPPTERVEMAGFVFPGTNSDIRDEVIRRVNLVKGYRRRFAEQYQHIRHGAPITYDELAASIAEFEFSLTFADAPLDAFARGQSAAMTDAQKRGAIVFFGKGGCVVCHAVAGPSNEMFSDFAQHVIAVPQIVPSVGNVTFDGPGRNEDFGLAQVTGREADRYAFRTSPLRNVALQQTFMHNGAFTRLEDAIRHHLHPAQSLRRYTPEWAGVAPDLQGAMGPIAPLLARLDRRLRVPTALTDGEFADLVEFVRNGLLDARATGLISLIPTAVPSGRPVHTFQ